jgi:signal transduction histidine kinase
MTSEDDLMDRIAGELHDGIVQWMVGAKMQAEAIRATVNSGKIPTTDQMDMLVQTLTRGLQESRRMMQGLAEPAIERGAWCEHLEYELRTLVEMIENPRPELVVKLSAAVGELAGPLAAEIYRLVRESVWNALKHAAARRITVDATVDGRLIVLRIRDNGRGFDTASQAVGRRGLLGMQRRAQRIHATMHIESTRGEGTEIRFEIPHENDLNSPSPRPA